MDLLLLGAMAVVLIALTVWLVWRPSTETGRSEATADMTPTPMGDEFEDQYTTATADLSAGGVALTTAHMGEEPAPEPTVQSASPSRWPEASIGTEGSATGVEGAQPRTAPPVVAQPYEAATRAEEPRPLMHTGLPTPGPDREQGGLPQAKTIGMGAAAALTLGGAAAGAWLYARWQRERNKPLNRLRRRFR